MTHANSGQFSDENFAPQNPLNPKALGVDDLRIGMKIGQYGMLNGKPELILTAEIASDPFVYAEELKRLKARTKAPQNDNPAFALIIAHQMITVKYTYARGIVDEEGQVQTATMNGYEDWFLADMGIVPYEDECWNTAQFCMEM